MSTDESWFIWRDETLMLRVRVQPRARKDELLGPEGGHLRVRIAAPPVGGKANERLRRFLAGQFGVPQSRVELTAGAWAGYKRVQIHSPRKWPLAIEPG